MSVFPYVNTCHEYIYAVFATGVCDLQGICNNNLANFKKKLWTYLQTISIFCRNFQARAQLLSLISSLLLFAEINGSDLG